MNITVAAVADDTNSAELVTFTDAGNVHVSDTGTLFISDEFERWIGGFAPGCWFTFSVEYTDD